MTAPIVRFFEFSVGAGILQFLWFLMEAMVETSSLGTLAFAGVSEELWHPACILLVSCHRDALFRGRCSSRQPAAWRLERCIFRQVIAGVPVRGSPAARSGSSWGVALGDRRSLRGQHWLAVSWLHLSFSVVVLYGL